MQPVSAIQQATITMHYKSVNFTGCRFEEPLQYNANQHTQEIYVKNSPLTVDQLLGALTPWQHRKLRMQIRWMRFVNFFKGKSDQLEARMQLHGWNSPRQAAITRVPCQPDPRPAKMASQLTKDKSPLKAPKIKDTCPPEEVKRLQAEGASRGVSPALYALCEAMVTAATGAFSETCWTHPLSGTPISTKPTNQVHASRSNFPAFEPTRLSQDFETWYGEQVSGG